jgi:hypothetical protein
MALRYLAIGSLALTAAVAASSSLPDLLHPRGMRPAAGAAHLYAVGSRSATERQSTASGKTDSILADLSRHAALARPAHLIADLHALSPAARFVRNADGTAMVAIDAATRGDPQALKTALQRLGLQNPAVYKNDVGGFLPVSEIEAAGALGEVASMRAAMSHTRASTGPVATQGDYAQRSDVVRTDYPSLTGTGVTVGIMSDSFNCYAVYAAPNSGVPASGAEGYAPNGFTADYASDVASGALPANVQDLLEPTFAPYTACQGFQSPDSAGQNTGLPFTDEGRAISQVVYAVAPGATLVFRTGAISEADFASGMESLAAPPYNAKVLVDDLGYFDEPFFQDGLLAQAIDTVEAQGVAYFSAAGNNQETPSYMNATPSFGTLVSSTAAPNSGEYLLNFDATGATTVTSLPVTIPPLSPGDFVAVVVEWDQPYVTGCTGSAQCTGATSQIDVCLTGSTGTDVLLDYDNDVTSCSGPEPLGTDPYQVMLIANPAVGSSNTAQQNINIQVGLVNGTPPPGRIIVTVQDDGQGSTINAFSPNGPTLQGHPGAAGAAAVGAAFYFDTPRCGTTPATLEAYSSAGGAPILFDTTGTRLATPVVRQKPDFVGPDGVNDTFLGFTLASDSPPFPSNGLLTTTITECQNKPSYPNFFGTSAATPHAAAIAALMLQANSSATPTQIYTALRSSALAMGSPSPNYNSGYGFIQADAALALIPPGAPKIGLSASSVVAGNPVTITWSSLTATGCTASGAWSGALKASGSQTVTPSAAGTDKYTLTCANQGGNSVASTATLTVTAATPPAAPSLKLAATSIVVGTSTTITWSSSNATSCTASGSWSGTLATSGTQMLMPTAAGTDTYSLTCSNAGGASKAATVTLTVTAAPSSGGGGGGALDGLSLLGLAALFAGRRARANGWWGRSNRAGAP